MGTRRGRPRSRRHSRHPGTGARPVRGPPRGILVPLHRLPALSAAALLLAVGGLAAAGPASGRTPPPAAAPAVAPGAVVRPDATGTALRAGTGLYPRVVRLAHSGAANGQLVASVVDFGVGVGVIHRSADGGATFQEVGGVHDPATVNGLCCSTLLELPRQIGAMPPGTLLWAASAGRARRERAAVDLRQARAADLELAVR